MRILNNTHIVQEKLSLPSRLFLVAMTFLVVPFSWQIAAAQMGAWFKADTDPANSPPSQHVHAMTYDETRGVVVLQGGTMPFRKKETWEWNGAMKSWTQVSNEGPDLSGFDIAYDPTRDVVVLSGGAPARIFVDAETWEWDHTSWNLMAKEEGAIVYPAMAYHPVRKSVIRHGGFFNANLSGSTATMEWKGEEWMPLPDGPALSKHRMVYDSKRDKMVVFGGLKELGVISNETWEFDGTAWVKVADYGPEGRDHFGMAFDSNRGVTVLFGGGLIVEEGFSEFRSFNDTWQWDGKEWTQIITDGPTESDKNFALNMAFDPSQNQIVLFGGSFGDGVAFRPNDTWLFSFESSGIPHNLWLKY